MDFQAGLDKDGSEFMRMLNKSKMKFGPYAVQLAEEFFDKQMKKMEQEVRGVNPDEQEKISFLKMEMFLYGISEADRLIEQLKSMEKRINKLAQEADNKAEEERALRYSAGNFDRAPSVVDPDARKRE